MTARSRLPALLVGVLAAVVLAAGLVAVAVHEDPTPARATEAAGDRPAASGDAAAPETERGPTCPTATPPTAPPRPATAAEPAYVKELKAQVAEARGLEWRAPLVVEAVPRPELVRRLKAANERYIRPERMAGDGATFQILGLIPRNLDYQKAVEDLLSALVAGFYDPRTKELVVDGDGGEPDPGLKLAIAHELNHALTDQWFDFGSREDALDDADRQEEVDAFVALIEGDAKLLEDRFADRFFTEEDEALYVLGQLFGGDIDPEAAAAVERAQALPEFLKEYLYFPYEEGKAFAEEVAKVGGFKAVDEALCRPPTSTEQILHPELYRDGQGWAPPELPDMAAATQCESVRRGTLGEFKMSQVLQRQLGVSTSTEAADGWHGDTFHTVRCGRALGLVDRWVADSEEDAAQLARALNRWRSARGVAGRVTQNGTQVDLVVADDRATTDRLAAALG